MLIISILLMMSMVMPPWCCPARLIAPPHQQRACPNQYDILFPETAGKRRPTIYMTYWCKSVADAELIVVVRRSRPVVNNAMYHSCPPFCIALDRWSVWLLYHPGPLLSDLLPWWCYCWWCWWPGGEQCITLVPSFVSLLYHSALLLSAGWSLVL